MSAAHAPAGQAGLSRTSWRAWLTCLVVCLVLLSLPFLIRLDGKPHADWEQFLGRFHVLALHIPIGLILLVPVLEIAGAFRPALREAAGFVLALACAASLATVALGFLLAHGGGESGPIVTRHLWGGIMLSIVLITSLLVRPAWQSAAPLRVYPWLLATAVLVLVWTAHQGGTLAHGSGYLTAYMPSSFQRWSWLGSADAAAPNSIYAKRIHPILDSNCVSCHGAGKTEAGLRLDSYDAVLRGGKDGAVVVAAHPERSILLQRITLPSNDKHFMPAEGRPPLRPEQIVLLRAWVQQGASPSATTLAGFALGDERKELPPQPVGDYSALMPQIRDMQSGQGVKLLFVSTRPSDGLILSANDAPSSFGDAQFAQFIQFAPYIVEADLARTAVTDASFDTLARFTHLRALHLEGTAITGSGLAKLAPLSQLTYLNLSGTHVSASAIAPLQSMKNLRHIYLFDTPAQPAPAAEANQAARSTQ